MDSKLTLKLDKAVIEQAKIYAKKQGVSLSSIVENYLALITNKKKSKEIEISPFVKSISGSVKVPDDFDYKKARDEYLMEKYK